MAAPCEEGAADAHHLGNEEFVVVLAKAKHTTAPLDAVENELSLWVTAALGDKKTTRR
ncbi:hypothetical protein ACFYT3_31725 [Nocardia amikacinitolerans]|uniref:hypothetical protein n=1 Tax=Nocardia amikacinitolerans TaxID=756689 RepID=UPI0036AC0FA5